MERSRRRRRWIRTPALALSAAALVLFAIVLGGPSPAGARRAGLRPGLGPGHLTSVRVLNRSAAAALRSARLGLELSGPARATVQVSLRFAELRRRRAEGVAVAAPIVVALSPRGRSAANLALSPGVLDRVRATLARCDRLVLTARLSAVGRPGIRATDRVGLRVPACPVSNAKLAELIRTPAGGYRGRAPGHGSGRRSDARRPGRPARFEVGASVADFSPPPAGHGPGDTANCDSTGAFDGPRPFAFTEPYKDVQHLGHYVGPPNPAGIATGGSPTTSPGDPYLDCNGNGRWEGNLLGGGSSTPRFYTKVADPVTARAFVASNGAHTIAVEVVDQEGLFNVYQQEIRARVAADGVHLDNVFISATHDESAPDSLGLGGVDTTTSGVNDYWLRYFVARSAQAIEAAYHAMRPATIRYTEALEPANLRQCWSSYPFVDDQHIPILQAVGTDGKAIVTVASVAQHAETLAFNGGSSALDAQRNWVSADWVSFFRQSVQRRFGGVAIEMAGAVGSNESPEVYKGTISRTPQQQIGADHPAGCRTEFQTPNGADTAGTGHVALGYNGETQAFGDDLAQSVIGALRSSYPSRTNVIWGARSAVCVPLTNLLFEAAAVAGVFAHRPGYGAGCTTQSPVAADGSTLGTSLLSQVASFRIGDGQFISLPGEVFPFTYLGSFLGPQDMPTPGLPMTPMLMPHLHTPFRFVDGLGEDMLGYIFPAGNAVGIPSTGNPQAIQGDRDRFGCNHSDDAEATGPNTGEIVGNALVTLLDAHGGPAETQISGRYVLPDGTLSRDPLGGPESLQCNANQVFHPDGPAIGVELPGGVVVHPLAWMSLSGLPQSRPDRDTRGYYDARGRRVWLNVYPDVTLP